MTDLRSLLRSSRKGGARMRLPLVEDFALQLQRPDIPVPVREFAFHPSRKWRSDFAWPAARLLVEVDGGTYGAGRASGHTSVSGMARDREKDAAAAILRYHVIRVDAKAVRSGQGVEWVAQFFTHLADPTVIVEVYERQK